VIRRLLFVASSHDAPPPDGRTRIVVLDTAWTPPRGGRPDVIPIRPVVARVLEQRDLIEESLTKLDRWAQASGLADRFMADGLSWWFRRRTYALKWVHYRALWALVLEQLLSGDGIEEIELQADEPSLADVLPLVARSGTKIHLHGPIGGAPGARTETVAGELAGGGIDVLADTAGDNGDMGTDAQATDGTEVKEIPTRRRAVPAEARAGGVLGPIRNYLARRQREQRRRERVARAAEIERRIGEARSRRHVLVLSSSRTKQTLRIGDQDRRLDPFLASVIDQLGAAGVHAVVLGFGLDRRRKADWPTIDGDSRILPDSVLLERYRGQEMERRLRQAWAAVRDQVVATPELPLEIGGVDLGPKLLASVRDFAKSALRSSFRARARAAGFLDEFRPAALVLVNEYSRASWVSAALERGIPVFAIQHGIIHADHPGYRHPRHDGIPYPTQTFLFGSYEARLLQEIGGFRVDEIVVAGSPRLDLVPAHRRRDAGRTRDRIRRSLKVAAADRMLVISTTWEELQRRIYLVAAIGRLFDAPLPGVHVVFKQHPAELDDGPYRALIEGLARAGGFSAPPVSVVRDIDLFQLLEAADAHLGLYSTVLTDAVVAGVVNLIAVPHAHRDLLDYIGAGVARPVASAAELVAALDDPVPPDEERRRAFLAQHFEPGEASGRIVAAIRGSLDAESERRPA
jgi:hypothetical protein